MDFTDADSATIAAMLHAAAGPSDCLRLQLDGYQANKVAAGLRACDRLGFSILSLHDVLHDYLAPDSSEAVKVRGTAPSIEATYHEYIASLDNLHERHEELNVMIFDVIREMREDERTGTVLRLSHNASLPPDPSSRTKEPALAKPRFEARSPVFEPGPSIKGSSDDTSSFASAESSSETEQQIFDRLCTAQQARTPRRHDAMPHLAGVEKHRTEVVPSHSSPADFDPCTATASECQARDEAWLSLHPGLRAGARRSHSRQTRRRDRAEERRRTKQSSITPLAEIEASTRRALRQALSDHLKQQAKELDQDTVESEKQHQDLPRRTKSKQHALRYNEASLPPQRARDGKGKSNAEKLEHTPHHNLPCSALDSPPFYDGLCGAATLDSGPSPNKGGCHNEADSFTEALADIHFKDHNPPAGTQSRSRANRADIMPRVSGHAYPPEGLEESEVTRETNRRIEQELMVETVAWYRERALKGRNRSVSTYNERHFR